MRLVLPKLYVILDAEQLPGSEVEVAEQLLKAGVRLFQYRNKNAPPRETLQSARELSRLLKTQEAFFFVNDRPDVAYLAEASGVHVGQDDLGADEARTVLGPGRWVGVSTHNEEQFEAALETTADYIAVGPIFATSTKLRPDPVVGTELLRRVRGLTKKTIVAIGGITLERASEVMEAGADSVAVISEILRAQDPGERARQFLEALAAAPSPTAE
jgi:thiamine-phosphate pyrophosphorylase